MKHKYYKKTYRIFAAFIVLLLCATSCNSETNDNATSSIKVDNKEQDNNAGSVNGTSIGNEHLDDTFDNLKFDETKEKDSGSADFAALDAASFTLEETGPIPDMPAVLAFGTPI